MPKKFLVLILIQLLKQKKLWAEIEANQIVFGFLASLGLVFALLYSFVYSGNPLTFAGGGWWLRSPIEGLDLIRGNLVLTGTYILHALYYMIGKKILNTNETCKKIDWQMPTLESEIDKILNSCK